jgi:putative ABC transport system permease protein
MFRNYLVVAWRNLVRNKVYSAINITGLAVGLACCLLILLFVKDELRYDKFHQKAERIYRVTWRETYGDRTSQTAVVPAVLGPTLKDYFPEIVQVARFMRWPNLAISYGDEQFFEKRLVYADPPVFEAFDFKFIAGDPSTALSEPYSLVLTEQTARKYFGGQDPLGKVMSLDSRYPGSKQDYQVTGVIEDLPPTHLKFDMLGSMQGLYPDALNKWNVLGAYVYLLLPEGYSAADLEAKLPAFVEERIINSRPTLLLQPLTDIHLHSHLQNEAEPNSDIRYLYIYSTIAGLVLLIACINFVNLSTARAGQRAREVGMRKVLGANRPQLIGQFLGEAVVLSLIALVLAAGLTELVLPAFNGLYEKSLRLDYVQDWRMVLVCLAGTLGIGLLSGAYSALVLTAFHPVQVLKGIFSSGTSHAWLRRGLVIFQFAVSTALAISTVAAYAQLRYLQKKDLGFDKEQVIVVSNLGNPHSDRYGAFKEELLRHIGVRAVSAGNVPGDPSTGMTSAFVLDDGRTVKTYHYDVDYDYLETLGLHLVWGRDFSRDFATDEKEALIVSETFEKVLGQDLESISRYLGSDYGSKKIIGMVRDFHVRSLHEQIEPVVFHLRPGDSWHILVRFDGQNTAGVLDLLRDQWKAFFPDRPFVYSFLDEGWAAMYRAEQRQGQTISAFAILTILVACLGLLGLAAYVTERRTKEIGIRKVLGASVPSIVVLLSKEFTCLVLVANLIAWPLAWYAMHRWLESFAYRIELGPGVFVLGGVLALLIAWLTVSFQAIRAARANPVEALRYE